MQHECIERIEKALEGKPANALVKVLAADVVCLGSHLKARDAVAEALRDGAARALEGWREERDGPLSVWQQCDQLRRFLNAVKQG